MEGKERRGRKRQGKGERGKKGRKWEWRDLRMYLQIFLRKAYVITRSKHCLILKLLAAEKLFRYTLDTLRLRNDIVKA